jgi:glycosyltransferase involved in cell wall biosynthesis
MLRRSPVEKGNNPRVSIIIPAFNEEGNLEELCRQMAEMQKASSFTLETVIVDDGSTDSTGSILRQMADTYSFVRPVSHSSNRGLTAALETGFTHARGDIFVFYPADLQYKPEDIPRLVEKIDMGNDVVTGWKQGQYKKRLVSTVYNWLSRRLFNLKVHDLNSVKAFHRKVVEGMFLRRDWHRYIVPLAAEQGYRIDEVKIQLYPRYRGKSKFSIWRIPIGVLDMLAVKSQLTFLRKPLLFFGIIGSSLVVGGVVVGAIAVYLRYVHDLGLRPLLYLVILLVTMGISIFILGFLSEGMAAIREELGQVRGMVKRLERGEGGRTNTGDTDNG